MATLNTLRTKGGVIVSIVIGVSLIAFLLGDLTSTGSRILGKKQREVGMIDGNSIDYMEFTQEADYMTRIAQLLSGTESLTQEQTDQAREMAWQSLIAKYSTIPGFESTGITVGEGEQIDMVNGQYISSVLMSMFRNPSTGVYDPEMLRNFTAGKDADPNASMLWDYLKEQMLQERMTSKYATLVASAMFVNNLEVENAVHAANNSYSALYTGQSYSTIADSLVKVTDSQIKKYYSEHKDMFRQGESRDIEYVIFDMVPSEQDYADAKQHIAEIATEFAASDDPMQYASVNSQQRTDARYMKADAIPAEIASAIMANERKGVYGPVLNGDVYTLARVGGVRSMPDSIGASHILLAPGNEVLADSIVKALKGNASFAELAAKYSLDQQAAGGDLGMFAPENMIPEISDKCIEAAKGDVFTANSAYGLHVVKVTAKSAPVQKFQVATITYEVQPSPATEQDIYGKASAFLSAAHGSTDKFNSAVTSSDISKRSGHISSTDRNVNGLQNSRELVRWAFNNKKGAVSEIMEINGDYVVAALTEVRHEGTAPVQQAAVAIRGLLRREAKAEMLAQKMTGASLAELASTLGAKVDTANNVLMSAYFVDGLGVEPALVGAICSAQKGQLSKPVKSDNGVYVFNVTDIQTTDNATPESVRVSIESNNEMYIGQRINQALMEESKIVDTRTKFF